MKKLLIIALLIVGCDNATESSVDPLVGTWEASEMTMTVVGVTVTVALNDPTSELGTITYIFGADGVASITSTDEDGTESAIGTWSSTAGKLTLNIDGETLVMDFALSGNTLTLSSEVIEDGTTMLMAITFIRQ